MRRRVARVAAGLFGSSSVRFVLLSGTSFGVNFGGTIALHEGLGLREEFAFAAALAVALVANFLGMRHFVYPGQTRGALGQFLAFLGSSSGFRGLEYGTFLALHTWGGVPYKVVVVATLGGSTVLKYFVYKNAVFAPSPAATPAR